MKQKIPFYLYRYITKERKCTQIYKVCKQISIILGAVCTVFLDKLTSHILYNYPIDIYTMECK